MRGHEAICRRHISHTERPGEEKGQDMIVCLETFPDEQVVYRPADDDYDGDQYKMMMMMMMIHHPTTSSSHLVSFSSLSLSLSPIIQERNA